MGRAATRRTTWTAAGAASLLAHLVLFVPLLWWLGRQAAPTESPTLDVRLVTLTPRRPPPVSERTRRPSPVRPRAAPNPPPDLAPAPFPETPPAPDAAAGVARALRRALGCREADLPRLSPEDRAHCLRSDGLARGGGSPRLNFDRTGRFARDPEPYLARRPRNGCKARTGGTKDPMGKEGEAVGIACAWSF